MLEQLRGRNLAHVGCTLGLTLGLTLGILAGLVTTLLVRSESGVTLATVAFFGITFGLGALGYYLGGRSSQRLDDTGVGALNAPPVGPDTRS